MEKEKKIEMETENEMEMENKMEMEMEIFNALPREERQKSNFY